MNDLSDDDLVRLFAAGDEAAFSALFARHHGAVFGYALTILRNRQDAEDVMVDTFAAMARAAGGYRPEGLFRAWLLRITRNRSLTRVTRDCRRAAWQVPSHEAGDAEPVSEGPGPAQAVATADDHTRVAAAFAHLSPHWREALGLYAFDHLRYEEIAAVLDTPVNTVKTWIRRARMQLAREMERSSGGHPKESAR